MFCRTLPKAPTFCIRCSKACVHTVRAPQRRTNLSSLLGRFHSSRSEAVAAMDKKWWDKSTVAVVTGANKGIGYEIAGSLAKAGMIVVVTSRSEDLGKAALGKLQASPDTSGSDLQYHQLDITDSSSIKRFAEWVKQQHGKVDILINNAGIAYKGNTFGADEAATTIATNFLGTRDVCEALEPLITKPGGRIVNVTSGAGLLQNIPDDNLRSKFDNPKGVNELVALGNKFVDDIRAGQHQQQGWPSSMYGISKCLENSYTRVLAQQWERSGVMVNACSPGYCATDMSSHRGPRSAAEGADTPVWLALLPQDEFITGGFYKDRKQQSFV